MFSPPAPPPLRSPEGRRRLLFSSEMPNQEELLPFCPPARLSGIAWVRARSLRAGLPDVPVGDSLKEEKE